jgi:hypothetical protein
LSICQQLSERKENFTTRLRHANSVTTPRQARGTENTEKFNLLLCRETAAKQYPPQLRGNSVAIKNVEM